MRPRYEVFAKAVKRAYRKTGFAATAVRMDRERWEPGDVKDDLVGFPISLTVIRRVTRKEWQKWIDALAEELPAENQPNPEKGRFRYYEVKPIFNRKAPKGKLNGN